jgi:hypothetical protein
MGESSSTPRAMLLLYCRFLRSNLTILRAQSSVVPFAVDRRRECIQNILHTIVEMEMDLREMKRLAKKALEE